MRMNTPYIPTRAPDTSLHQNCDAMLMCLLASASVAMWLSSELPVNRRSINSPNIPKRFRVPRHYIHCPVYRRVIHLSSETNENMAMAAGQTYLSRPFG